MDIPIVYLCIHKRLRVKSGMSCILTKKKIEEILGRLYRVDKCFRVLVIKELIAYELIHKTEDGDYLILDSHVDLENTSALYQSMGLF